MTCPLDPLARQLRKPLSIFYAYCLMSNHLHLLLREFQDRFRSEPVDSLEYFVTLLRYIHQNPLKAGIVNNILDYPWSSWKEYAFDSNSNTFCSTRAVFSRISKEDLRELV